jgi:predicted dehydrogenase
LESLYWHLSIKNIDLNSIVAKKGSCCMRTVKIGIIGAGGICQTHLRALQSVEGTEVIAICDIVPERADATAKKFGIPNVFYDHRKMLEMDEIEAVSVLTYNQAHCGPTVDALRAGKHVLCEKPMAATLVDAAAMTKASHETDKILMIALKTRYSPHMIKAKKIAMSGALGDIYYSEAVACRRCGIPGWNNGSFMRKETAGIGAVADIGVYSLDAALFVMGHPKPIAVSGIANNLLGSKFVEPPVENAWEWDPKILTVEDFGAGSVRFDNGGMMVFKTSWVMHMDSLGETLFLGTKGGLKLDPLTLYRNEFGMMKDEKLNVESVEDIQLFISENIAFADAIRNHKPTPIPADQMLLTNVIIQGMIDSAAAGKEVAVSVPTV